MKKQVVLFFCFISLLTTSCKKNQPGEFFSKRNANDKCLNKPGH